MGNKRKYDIAAYIWPAYHYEPLMEHFWPEKDGEWYTVRRGTPRFPGHYMPRIPLLGYQDEADPEVMKQHVGLGEKYGVNTFIMDWYWYNNGPCFERQLNEGLIPALKGTDSRFYLMWANHDATTLWDMHTDNSDMLFSGLVKPDDFKNMMDRIIDKYFKLDCYYLIEGKPVFSVYSSSHLIVGLEGMENTRNAFEWLRNRVVEKGFPGIHIQFITRTGNIPAVESFADLEGISYEQLASDLEVDSTTNYQFICDIDDMGDWDYVKLTSLAISKWEITEKNTGCYFPMSLSVGIIPSATRQKKWL